MLVEVKISPLGKDSVVGNGAADIRRLIENSRSSFYLTPSRVWIEGERSEVVSLLKRCHIRAASLSLRLLATSYDGRKRQASENAGELKRYSNRRHSSEAAGLAASLPAS